MGAGVTVALLGAAVGAGVTVVPLGVVVGASEIPDERASQLHPGAY